MFVAGYCGCCECVGRRCIVSHPGHSHRVYDWKCVCDLWTGEKCVYHTMLAEAVIEVQSERLREACDL